MAGFLLIVLIAFAGANGVTQQPPSFFVGAQECQDAIPIAEANVTVIATSAGLMAPRDYGVKAHCVPVPTAGDIH